MGNDRSGAGRSGAPPVRWPPDPSRPGRASSGVPAAGSAWPLSLAFGLAVVLVFSGGIGYRAVAARYASVPRSAPLPPGTLASLPLVIGDWVGHDLPLDERIVERTDTDDHLNRRYARPGGAVSLWVAYGVRLRDLMPHRPDVCYTGAGWVLNGETRLSLPAADGSVVPGRLLTFRKSGLDGRQLVVLNYYLVGDAYSPDVQSLRAQASRLRPDTDFVVQVQVVQDGAPDGEEVGLAVRDFAARAAPILRQVILQAVGRGGV